MELFRYGCTAIQGLNKAGVMVADENGFYDMVLGGFNVHNSADAWYPWTPSVQTLFSKSSAFQRRIMDGALRGELGHPRMVPGMTDRQFMSRILDIYEPNVCQMFGEVWADDSLFKGRDGQPIIAILGKVKPFGDKKEALLDALETPKANACQSIRSLTDDTIRRGRVEKEVRAIITWDHVNEPGIAIARKWNSPSLESRGDTMVISRDMLDQLVERRQQKGLGTESSCNMAKSIILDIGARKPKPGEFVIPLGGSTRW
jgi:hypothetical protein